jgi:membrane protease YdiL (CAAX protease family)
LLQSAGATPEESLLIPDLENPSPAAVVALLGTQAVCFVAVAWILLRLRLRPEPRPRSSHPALAIALGVAAGGVALLLAGAATRILEWLGVDVTEQAWLVSLASNEPAVLWGLAPWLVVIAPFAEEVFFRGYVFRFVTERGGLVLGIVVSSLLFALVHFHPPLLAVYFLYGILFAWLYRWTGRLIAPVTAHVTVNLVGVVVLGVTAGQAV